jgi:hypothetical protein
MSAISVAGKEMTKANMEWMERKERRGTMDRKKIIIGLAAFLSGAALSMGSAHAQFTGLTGYLQGDPAPGKLVPYYQVADNLATLIGIENTSGKSGPGAGLAFDVSVHVRVFTTKSVEQTDFDLCLSPFDFGYVVLQKSAPSAGQLDELFGVVLHRFNKARVLSVDNGDLLTAEGYLTLRSENSYSSTDGSCSGVLDSGLLDGSVDGIDLRDGSGEPLAAWAILQDIGSGFFATEIPVITAVIDVSSGGASGGFGAFGLIPRDNAVIARFDVNPTVDAKTSVYVWLTSNGPSSGRNITAWLDCEDEFEQSTTIPLPNEVNVINPDALSGISQCKQQKQYRGVLRFAMPDTGFLWSQISQSGQHYRENFLGYNLECNNFIDESCAIGVP